MKYYGGRGFILFCVIIHAKGQYNVCTIPLIPTLEPHLFFVYYFWWRTFMVCGTKLAPSPFLDWGVAFTACGTFLFFMSLCFYNLL
jgi:hypothetical protein